MNEPPITATDEEASDRAGAASPSALNLSVRVQHRMGAFLLNVDTEFNQCTTALIGPNGAGKSTLLRILSGILSPFDGRICLQQRTLTDVVQGIQLPPESRNIGYVPEGNSLFPHLRVIDNVVFGLTVHARKADKSERHEKAVRLLESLSCAHLSNRWPHTLSAGERQRIALARALLPGPTVLLLDEPFSSLDPAERTRTRHFFSAHLLSNEIPTIIASHDPVDVLELAQDVIVLEKGQVTAHRPLSQLNELRDLKFVRDFLATSS
jgi:molybdate transport system ATP-binding protein